MSVITVSKDELFGIIQYTNLIRAKFQCTDVWTVYPVLYSGYDSIDILSASDKSCNVGEIGDEVVFKFQRQGYEFLVNGEVIDKSLQNPATVTIKFVEAKKYYNLRKHVRFETDLKAVIKVADLDTEPTEKPGIDGQCFESSIKNISKGGSMFAANADLKFNDIIEMRIRFGTGSCFISKAKVLRKLPLQKEGFSYGVQFVESSEDNFKVLYMEIEKIERAYLKSLNTLREYKKTDSTFDTKIVIFSSDIDESYDIREALVKLGAENFDVINNFKIYFDFIAEEKPKLLIFDSNTMDEEAASLIDNIKTDFPEIQVLLILPIIFQEAQEYKHIFGRVDVLYKPLIYNEFEDKIIKYL